MPPRAREPRPEPAKARTKKNAEICAEHWPDGWPTEDTNSASCDHGQWSRDLPAPSEA
jgi:hypothetical protein